MTTHSTTTTTPEQQQRDQRGTDLQFPWKLHLLLEHAEKSGNDYIISWMPDGRSFQIRDKQAFSNELMPSFFFSSKFKSFQRNLNLWGFETILKGPNKGIRFHQYFVKGEPELCQLMTRTKVKGGSKLASATTSTTTSVELENENNALLMMRCAEGNLLSPPPFNSIGGREDFLGRRIWQQIPRQYYLDLLSKQMNTTITSIDSRPAGAVEGSSTIGRMDHLVSDNIRSLYAGGRSNTELQGLLAPNRNGIYTPGDLLLQEVLRAAETSPSAVAGGTSGLSQFDHILKNSSAMRMLMLVDRAKKPDDIIEGLSSAPFRRSSTTADSYSRGPQKNIVYNQNEETSFGDNPALALANFLLKTRNSQRRETIIHGNFCNDFGALTLGRNLPPLPDLLSPLHQRPTKGSASSIMEMVDSQLQEPPYPSTKFLQTRNFLR